MKYNITIVVIATNVYSVLGIRFIKKFNHFYKGKHNINFVVFSDVNIKEYLDLPNVTWIEQKHSSWVEATNSKFENILKTVFSGYIFYFDADTDIKEDFGDWFVGDLVGGEHYANKTSLANGVGYDKNPDSAAFIHETGRPKIYYYGAFFGGTIFEMEEMCKKCLEWQAIDRANNYEPSVNDESYINKYFHLNTPTMVKSEDFAFKISDKGGIIETRDLKKGTRGLLTAIKELKGELFDIEEGKIKALSQKIL